MTKSEFLNLTAFITSLYPDKSPFKAGENQNTALDAWFIMLEDVPYPEAVQGLKKHIRESVYFPTVADIRREYDAKCRPKQKTALQAYLNVKDAVINKGLSWSETKGVLDKQERRALRDFGFFRFLNSGGDSFTEKEFARYYENACTELAIV